MMGLGRNSMTTFQFQLMGITVLFSNLFTFVFFEIPADRFLRFGCCCAASATVSAAGLAYGLYVGICF